MTQIRLPELSGGSEAEQLGRMRSYLYTLAQQLQVAFDEMLLQQQALTRQVQSAPAQQTRQEQLAAVRSLILRSAEITEHFSEAVAQRLAGRFVAQSQFGTFTQETEQRISANSQELRQEFSAWEQLEAKLEGVDDSLLEVKACIRTGLLYETESGPVYGVELGQQELENGALRFRKFTRLTPERLSFYDSSEVEVAYISDRQLHVTSASVTTLTAETIRTTTLQLGDLTLQLTPDGHLRIV